MKTITQEINVYSFDELSEEAKENAINSHRDSSLQEDYWSEYILDDVKHIGALIGIDIDHIYYSGFCSQGDGACFEGVYEYKKGALKAIKEFAPTDKDLHDIAQNLQNIQSKAFYKLIAGVKHHGHYYHELSTNITVDNSDFSSVSGELDSDLKDELRSFMQWIYSRLEYEYKYQSSDDCIIENIAANDYKFLENGDIY